VGAAWVAAVQSKKIAVVIGVDIGQALAIVLTVVAVMGQHIPTVIVKMWEIQQKR
jgi:hypothetical protein